MGNVGFGGWVPATHFLNVLFLSLLLRSGLEILAAFPKLYLSDHCTPGREWLKLTRKQLPHDRSWTSLEEEESWPPWLALPGRTNLGLGRYWHFAAALGWLLTGAIYVCLLAFSAEWRRLVPTSPSIVPQAWEDLATYLAFDLPHGDPYNALQQLAYFAIVFLVAPLALATGAAMSPAVAARFPAYLRLLGGKQRARSVHFGCLVAFVLFTLVHTAMVVVHGLPAGLTKISLGSEHHPHALGIAVAAAGIAAVLAANAGATIWSLRRPRAVQRALSRPLEPLQRGLSGLVSVRRYSRDDISPFIRRNGVPPGGEEFCALAGADFRHWRLRVEGLVEQPVSLGLDELQRLDRSTQVTMHHCIQGWTAVAEWSGARVGSVLELARPLSSARYVVFYAFDDKSETAVASEPSVGEFYEAVPLELCLRPQALLAWELNGRPLTNEHGAPLRLRLEGQLGYKMVKWIRRVELVADYSTIGAGHGGWKEDHVYFGELAGI